MRVSYLVPVLLVLLSCTGGGGDGPGTEYSGAFCAQFEAKLRSCGLLSAGVFGECEEKRDEVRQCQYRCVNSAPCAEFEPLICEDTETGELARCFEACDPQFPCGDGTFYDTSARCDSWDDCSNGADERNCAGVAFRFLCADGVQSVLEGNRCNESVDCDDGSDELNCSMFTCADGEIIPADRECDGNIDCADQSDEASCVPATLFQCADGSGAVSIKNDRCDGNVDCPDGSDEVGCAVMTCN